MVDDDAPDPSAPDPRVPDPRVPNPFASEARKLAHRGDAAIAARISAMGSFNALLSNWAFWADKRQLPPKGDWRSWMIMAGRGFGKTRAGSEWIRNLAALGRVRIALIGATMDEARAVMVEGQSGILAVTPRNERPKWEPSRGRLSWRTGAEAFLYSGESPEKLRGPEHHFAWCDELAKWARPQGCWDMLQLGLRLGNRPRALVTTTPRSIALLRALRDDASAHVVTAATRDNLLLPDRFIGAMNAAYAGTRLGRQELDGELIDDVEGALWTRDMIEQCRAMALPDMRRVVVGVDPPVSQNGDACGIVVVGLGLDGRGYVLADCSVQGCSPEGWARAVANAARSWHADRVIVEANQGGDMVTSTLRAADIALPVRKVHASRGKSARAEPVAALYENGKVRHLGGFPDLEDQLCGLIAGGGYEGPGRSPDRADALVWAITELMLGPKGEPRIWAL